jgi:hypothetical protein
LDKLFCGKIGKNMKTQVKNMQSMWFLTFLYLVGFFTAEFEMSKKIAFRIFREI